MIDDLAARLNLNEHKMRSASISETPHLKLSLLSALARRRYIKFLKLSIFKVSGFLCRPSTLVSLEFVRSFRNGFLIRESSFRQLQ